MDEEADDYDDYVVPRDGITRPTEAEIVAYCREQVCACQGPKVVIVGDKVPYTAPANRIIRSGTSQWLGSTR